eukprot:284276-Pelagomonas_calceolata.AAC.1
MQKLVAEQIGKMNGHASPGFDCAVPLIKYATVLPCSTLKPGQSSRLHTVFTNFKQQACDAIPRQALWQHLQRTCMPTPFLKIIQSVYDSDEHILKDGEKTACVHLNTGVKQGCPLLPLLFSLYVNDIDDLAEGVHGAVTGTDDVH